MDLSHVITNTNLWAQSGFATNGAWNYPSSPSTYFWAGFIMCLSFGLLGLAFTWVKRLLGGGTAEL